MGLAAGRRMTLLPLILALDALDAGDLALRLQRKDPQALAELYDRYGRLAFGLILRVVRDAAMAEDLVQETVRRCRDVVPQVPITASLSVAACVFPSRVSMVVGTSNTIVFTLNPARVLGA